MAEVQGDLFEQCTLPVIEVIRRRSPDLEGTDRGSAHADIEGQSRSRALDGARRRGPADNLLPSRLALRIGDLDGRGSIASRLDDEVADILHEPSLLRGADQGLIAPTEGGQCPHRSAQGCFGDLAFGDVHGKDGYAVGHGLEAQLEPSSRAIGKRELVLHRCRSAFLHAPAQDREHLGLVDARVALRHRAADQGLARHLPLACHGLVDVEVAVVPADDLTAFEQVVENAPWKVL